MPRAKPGDWLWRWMRRGVGAWVAWPLVLLPAAAFFVGMLRESTNLPEMDDYDAVLGFLNGFAAQHGVAARVSYFFASQHVQYKLFFLHAVVLAQYGLTGGTNFDVLHWVGDALAVGLAGALWGHQRRVYGSASRRLLLFAPAVLVWFAPRYSADLNWAVGGLQNLAVVFFALASLWLIGDGRRGYFAAGCAALAACIGASGNGFVAAGVGCLALAQQRRPWRVVAWAAVTLGMAAAYGYRYVAIQDGPTPHTLRAAATLVLYPLLFLGQVGGGVAASALAGVAMLGYGGWLVSRGWRQRDSRTFYAALFVALTALGVTVTRHNSGLRGALHSRYAMYSQLLLVLLYLASVNLGVGRGWTARRQRAAFAGCVAAAAIFCAVTDVREGLRLDRREQAIRQHFTAWESDPVGVSLVPDEEPAMRSAGMTEFRARAERVLVQSAALGVYRPPGWAARRDAPAVDLARGMVPGAGDGSGP